MYEELMELPEVVTSVFVLVPKTAEEKEFITVIDRDKEGGRKLPGGGASKDRAIPISAVAEVFEETGLVVHHPTQKILEVHKASIDPATNRRKPHHWVAVKSLPPISDDATRSRWASILREKRAELAGIRAGAYDEDAAWSILHLENEIETLTMDLPLVLGSEIETAGWFSAEEILQAVAERKYFPDHGKAFKWYLTGRAESALKDILLDRRIISWFVDEDGCLVLCHDADCEVCDREEEPETEETMDRHLPKTELAKSALSALNAPVRKLRAEPPSPEKQILSGAVEVLFVKSDRFEDRIYLKRDFGPYPRERYPHAATSRTVSLNEPTSVAKVAEKFGVKAERHVAFSGKVLIAIETGEPKCPDLDFVSFSLNEPPPCGMLIGFMQAKGLLEAVERFNRAHGSSARLWMHEGWKGLLGKIKAMDNFRKSCGGARQRTPALV